MVKFEPIHDYVLTKKLHYHKKSSLIELPETTLTNKDLEVLAFNENRRTKTGEKYQWDIKVGDVVLVGKLAGLTINVENQEYLLIKESDIVGVYDDYAKV